ncbi:hypothetical protein SUGI_0315050 [Cryptomeria japonica]|nr:hypothetical protein SUGI_0315050 [Cryptomeria japonica]
MKVKIGTKVEVCSEEEGYGGAWFEGSVIGFGNGRKKRTFFVRYEKFVAEDLNGEALVEEVCLKNMRPIPPYKRMPKNLSAGIAVEALDSDCWWRGFIITRFRSPFSGEELFQLNSEYWPLDSGGGGGPPNLAHTARTSAFAE